MGTMVELSKISVPRGVRSLPSGLKDLAEAPLERLPDDLKEHIQCLAASIKTQGLLHPLLVREDGEGNYSLISGFCRFKAMQNLGTTVTEAKVVKIGEEEVVKYQLIENIQRKDANPMDIANSLREMMKLENMTQAALAKSVGKSAGWISQHMGLLKADPELQASVKSGDIGLAGARQLSSLPKAEQGKALSEAKQEAKESGKQKVSTKGARRQAQRSKRSKADRQLSLSKVVEREGEVRDEMIGKFIAEQYGDKKVPSGTKDLLLSFWTFLSENKRIFYAAKSRSASKPAKAPKVKVLKPKKPAKKPAAKKPAKKS